MYTGQVRLSASRSALPRVRRLAVGRLLDVEKSTRRDAWPRRAAQRHVRQSDPVGASQPSVFEAGRWCVRASCRVAPPHRKRVLARASNAAALLAFQPMVADFVRVATRRAERRPRIRNSGLAAPRRATLRHKRARANK